MNSVIIVGNICTDIETRTTQSGVNSCTFKVAVNRKYKNANGQHDADFLPCVAWRNTAEFISKYFKKGNRIGIRGSVQTRNYEAQDGSKRYITEIIVDDAEFVEKATSAEKPSERPAYAPNVAEEFTPVADDELPF